MEESMIPSLSTGVIGSRFVTQEDVETAKARRDEQWKAAYARLGQEPPPQLTEDSYDGRSLAEKLAANKVAKQEEWEEKTKLANQFRALEEDEIMFLDSVRERQEEEERQRKHQDGEEVQNFKQAVAAARTSVATNPPDPQLTKPVTVAPARQTLKRDNKKSLKGVIVKKKPKAPVAKSESGKKTKEAESSKDDEELPQAKKRRISESTS